MLVTAGLSVPASAGAADVVTRILLVGDSVTIGSDGDYTWRYFSWKGLEQTGAHVDFVGHTRTTLDGGGYADPDFDQDHASRWGMTMRDMVENPSEGAPAISDLVVAQDPDVIVETLGVNDMTWLGFDVETMDDQVRAFVAEARSAKADVDVVLGGVPQTWLPHVADFNAGLPDLAAELSTGASRVVAAPVPELVERVDTYDIAHPTTAGQIKIAGAVSVALGQLGVGRAITMPTPAVPGPRDPVGPTPGPPPPATEPPLVVPQVSVEEIEAVLTEPVPATPVVAAAPAAALAAPRLRVATLRAGRVLLSWSRVPGASGVRIWVRDLSSRRRAWTSLWADVAAPKLSHRLEPRPGRVYQFKVAAVGSTVSVPSNVVRVRVRAR